jgi:poly(3-hydroxybutyrate) depolymerase
VIAGGGAAALAARALSSAGVGLAVVAAALCPQGPTLAPGGALAERVQVGRLERAFLLRVPAEASAHPALVLAFHGGGGDGAAMPELVGRSLEPLAAEHDFLVAYPDGYAGHWNDCRGRATFPAKRLAVDDVGFVHALVQRLRREHHVDPTRVFALGFSNGGHMAYRLALEMPGEVAAAAAFARSGPQSLEYFSRLDGYAGPPSRTEVVAVERPETMRVERTRWSRPGSRRSFCSRSTGAAT